MKTLKKHVQINVLSSLSLSKFVSVQGRGQHRQKHPRLPRRRAPLRPPWSRMAPPRPPWSMRVQHRPPWSRRAAAAQPAVVAAQQMRSPRQLAPRCAVPLWLGWPFAHVSFAHCALQLSREVIWWSSSAIHESSWGLSRECTPH